MAVPQGNPKDSMKSTWRNHPEIWERPHQMLSRMNIYGEDPKKPFPVHQKSDPVPVLTDWSSQLWIVGHALWPMLLQRTVTYATGYRFHGIAAFFLYAASWKINAFRLLWAIRAMAQKTGFFDGDKHGRDDIPDVGVKKAANSLNMTTTIRPILTVFLAYRATAPISLSKWIPAELFLYSIVLDFFFYTYHRACHDVDWLWKYHRTHHLTKHPTPLLSSYADVEQEVIEIALVPLLTWGTLKLMGFPMGFYDWWLCNEYVIFAEAMGHSGLRVWFHPPGPSNIVLKWFGCELSLEDHDLHHRRGWKKSMIDDDDETSHADTFPGFNYGKQTRLWDRLFGTCGERVEADLVNVDWNHKVNMPLYNEDALRILLKKNEKKAA